MYSFNYKYNLHKNSILRYFYSPIDPSLPERKRNSSNSGWHLLDYLKLLHIIIIIIIIIIIN